MLVPWVRAPFLAVAQPWFWQEINPWFWAIFSKKDERFSTEWTFADRTSVMAIAAKKPATDAIFPWPTHSEPLEDDV